MLVETSVILCVFYWVLIMWPEHRKRWEQMEQTYSSVDARGSWAAMTCEDEAVRTRQVAPPAGSPERSEEEDVAWRARCSHKQGSESSVCTPRPRSGANHQAATSSVRARHFCKCPMQRMEDRHFKMTSSLESVLMIHGCLHDNNNSSSFKNYFIMWQILLHFFIFFATMTWEALTRYHCTVLGAGGETLHNS